MKKKSEDRAGKKRKLVVLVGMAVAVWLLGGCSLAKEELQTEGENKLVGVFMTNEYLDTGTSELDINWKGEVSFREEAGRIPGELLWDRDTDEFSGPSGIVFEGVEGYGIYSIELPNEHSEYGTGYSFQDEIFTELHIAVDDEGESMEATVYVEQDGPTDFYMNPVFQTPDGEIYMQKGSAVSCETWAEGQAMSQTISTEHTRNRNGEETKKRASFTVHVICKEKEETANLICMNSENKVIDTISSEALLGILSVKQQELRIPAGTAYLIAERQTENGEMIRTVCSRGEEFLNLMRPLENGYLVPDGFTLVWE